MSEHLSSEILSALADGELSAEQLASAQEHLAACPACTSSALYQTMLKTATARAGRRYALPVGLQEQLSAQASRGSMARRPVEGLRIAGWAAACAMVLVSAGGVLVQRNGQQRALVSAQEAGLVTEVCDQHIAMLAADAPPEVVSSDRHTVKPWFQGKLPFSFNLPENLPSGVTLDGANLSYLGNQPVAQLLYSIGRHRVSVFVRARRGAASPGLSAEHSGFHVAGFRTEEMEAVAVSDVDRARLVELVGLIEHAQTGVR